MSTAVLDHVLLSNPTVIELLDDSGQPSSWIQLAKIGKFVSKRYGKFEISKEDLAQMLHNWREVTPKAPTELPVDYDHLSMNPKTPGDGVAAGWMKNIEARDDGDTLWAKVNWTPKAAEAIKNGEYRFVSPSFVKDHVHKDGTKVGTTLLAAAITNHPFLEGMEALTLYNDSALGELALDDTAPPADPPVVADEPPKPGEGEQVINLPFASYENFDACVAANSDKEDPAAYCGWLQNQVEARADRTLPFDLAVTELLWQVIRQDRKQFALAKPRSAYAGGKYPSEGDAKEKGAKGEKAPKDLLHRSAKSDVVTDATRSGLTDEKKSSPAFVASARANAMTKMADAQNTILDHLNAGAAHTTAAEAHAQAGNNARYEAHSAKATDHFDKAERTSKLVQQIKTDAAKPGAKQGEAFTNALKGLLGGGGRRRLRATTISRVDLKIPVIDVRKPVQLDDAESPAEEADDAMQPFLGFANIADCVAQNADLGESAGGYCEWAQDIAELNPAVDVPTLKAQWAALPPEIKAEEMAEAAVPSPATAPPVAAQVTVAKTLRALSVSIDLSLVGQRVMVAPGDAHTMDEVGATMVITEVIGEGDDAFIAAKDSNGVVHKWFRSTELLPASATPAQPASPNLVPGVGPAGVSAQANPTVSVVHPAIAEQIAQQGGQAVPGTPVAPVPGTVQAPVPGAAVPGTVAPGVVPGLPGVAAGAGTDTKAVKVVSSTPTETAEASATKTTKTDAKGKDGKAAAPDTATGETPTDAGSGGDAGQPAPAVAAVPAPAGKKPQAQDAVTAHVHKVVKALIGKKVTNMMFKLRTDENTEVEVTSEQLEAAGIRLVPEGSEVIPTGELGALKGKVTSLSGQVDTLATAAETAAKALAHQKLETELNRLSTGAFISKPQRDYALKTWGETTDLTAFTEWAATFTQPIVSLNKAHGHGEETTRSAGEEATSQLMELANTLVRDEGISLRQAIIRASASNPEAAERYRESFQLVR